MSKYSKKFRTHAVNLALEEMRQNESSKWGAAVAVASKLGCSAASVWMWHEKHAGEVRVAPVQLPLPPLTPTGEPSHRLQALISENQELRRTNENLRKALAVFTG